MLRIIKYLLGTLALLFLSVAGIAYLITYHPDAVESVEVKGQGGEPLRPGQELKVLSWNVQYMGGKNYVFYYDLPGDAGPDSRPSAEDIALTLDEVARIIHDENPDIILLQEMDVDSRRTDRADQMALLGEKISPQYRYSAQTYYHRALFVPHRMIMGRVGLSLGVFSKYPISGAKRHQLAMMPMDFFTRMFYLKRCVLDCRLPVQGGGELAVLNTHLDAFAQGTDTMLRQAEQVRDMLAELDAQGLPWLIGGDFNLLPPGQRHLISPSRQCSYNAESELAILSNRWPSVPAVIDCIGPDRERWFTHFPNDPSIKAPDRTIDYIFYSRSMRMLRGSVRSHDTLRISDHLPVLISLRLPAE